MTLAEKAVEGFILPQAMRAVKTQIAHMGVGWLQLEFFKSPGEGPSIILVAESILGLPRVFFRLFMAQLP